MKLQTLSFVVALSALLVVGSPDLLAKGKKPPKGNHGNNGNGNNGNNGKGGGKGGKGEGGGNCGKGGEGEDGDHGGDCGENHCKQEAQVDLVRPEPAPDADATGTLRIRSEDDGQRFEVRAQNLDVTLATDVLIEDPADSDLFTVVGAMSSKCNEFKLKLDTEHGDALPLGVASLADIAGRDVQVRSGADIVLTGTVPSLDPADCGQPGKAKAIINAPAGAPAPDMYGKLTLRSKADKGQEKIDLKVKNVPWQSGPFHVFIEDPSASGTFTNVGDLVQKGASSNGCWKRDTKHGDTLPLGVTSVADLADRTIQLRDDFDVVYLSGTIPALE